MKCWTNMPGNTVTDTFYSMLTCHDDVNDVIQDSKDARQG